MRANQIVRGASNSSSACAELDAIVRVHTPVDFHRGKHVSHPYTAPPLFASAPQRASQRDGRGTSAVPLRKRACMSNRPPTTTRVTRTISEIPEAALGASTAIGCQCR